jgi:hypothetical protein
MLLAGKCKINTSIALSLLANVAHLLILFLCFIFIIGLFLPIIYLLLILISLFLSVRSFYFCQWNSILSQLLSEVCFASLSIALSLSLSLYSGGGGVVVEVVMGREGSERRWVVVICCLHRTAEQRKYHFWSEPLNTQGGGGEW